MNFNAKEIFTAFMVLFAVIDIVGNIPIIIDLRKKEYYEKPSKIRREKRNLAKLRNQYQVQKEKEDY